MRDQFVYLERVHGVKGVFVADAEGKLIESSWDAQEDRTAAERVALMVSLALQGIQSEGGEASQIYLTYENGRVVVSELSEGYLVVLCMLEANMLLLGEAVKRCAKEIEGYLQEKEPVERLRKVCIELLGDQATKPLEMLASTEPTSKALHRTCKEIEDYTRILIDAKKADQIAKKMREVLKNQVFNNMKDKGEA